MFDLTADVKSDPHSAYFCAYLCDTRHSVNFILALCTFVALHHIKTSRTHCAWAFLLHCFILGLSACAVHVVFMLHRVAMKPHPHTLQVISCCTPLHCESYQCCATWQGQRDVGPGALGMMLHSVHLSLVGIMARGGRKWGRCSCYDAALLDLSFVWAVGYGEGGRKWGRRRPRWLMVERTYLHSLWRASQAAHRWWATPDTPSAPLASIPVMHKVGHYRPLIPPLQSSACIHRVVTVPFTSSMAQWRSNLRLCPAAQS